MYAGTYQTYIHRVIHDLVLISCKPRKTFYNETSYIKNSFNSNPLCLILWKLHRFALQFGKKKMLNVEVQLQLSSKMMWQPTMHDDQTAFHFSLPKNIT